VGDETRHLIEGAILGAVFSALISTAITIWIERLRQPKLRLSIEQPPLDSHYGPGSPATEARYLRLVVRNEPAPGLLSWITRLPALQCRGEITFHHLDGQKVMDRIMRGRWAESPEPLLPVIVAGGVAMPIIDQARINAESRVDIQPGEGVRLDIAARFDDEQPCYGWNNEAYSHNWRSPQWALPPGRYVVRAVVISSGQKHELIVRLVNDVPRADFRLCKAAAGDSPTTIERQPRKTLVPTRWRLSLAAWQTIAAVLSVLVAVAAIWYTKHLFELSEQQKTARVSYQLVISPNSDGASDQGWRVWDLEIMIMNDGPAAAQTIIGNAFFRLSEVVPVASLEVLMQPPGGEASTKTYPPGAHHELTIKNLTPGTAMWVGARFLVRDQFIYQVNKDYKTKMFSKEFGKHFIDTLQFTGEHVSVRNEGAYHFSADEN
jgi:hypothetical protein